jgi:hypothetical protein
MKLWEITRHLIVSHVPVRRRLKKPLLKPLLFWRMERDVIRFTGPFLRCRAVILSVLDLVVYNVKYFFNLCVRYTEEEGSLDLEPLIT